MSLTGSWSGSTYTASMKYKGSEVKKVSTTVTAGYTASSGRLTVQAKTGTTVRASSSYNLTASIGEWSNNKATITFGVDTGSTQQPIATLYTYQVDAGTVYTAGKNAVTVSLSSSLGQASEANEAPGGWTYWGSGSNGKTSSKMYVPKYTQITPEKVTGYNRGSEVNVTLPGYAVYPSKVRRLGSSSITVTSYGNTTLYYKSGSSYFTAGTHTWYYSNSGGTTYYTAGSYVYDVGDSDTLYTKGPTYTYYNGGSSYTYYDVTTNKDNVYTKG